MQTAYQQVRNMLSEHKVTLERIAQELRRQETVDAKRLGQILVETGISLAEVAPTLGAETVGADGQPATLPDDTNGANGNNGADGNSGAANGAGGTGTSGTTPTPGASTTPDWLTPPQN